MSPSHAPSHQKQHAAQDVPISELDSKLPPAKDACLPDQTAQCYFLCLEGKNNIPYAVQLPHVRPTPPRRDAARPHRPPPSKDAVARQAPLDRETRVPPEPTWESDAAVYRRFNEICFRYQGQWKRLIPFYGVVNVREVEVGRDVLWLAGLSRLLTGVL
jgi:hypothetical protein